MTKYFLRFYLLILISHFSFLAHAGEVNWHDFDSYQETLSKADVENRIKQFLQKDLQIEDHYKITDDALYIYASKAEKDVDNHEFVFRFGDKLVPEKEGFAPPNLENDKPLQGLRVAIDPGHIGGDYYSKVEAKYIDMEPKSKIGDHKDIQFNEGTLTFLTANRLKELLEEYGADVFVTRKEVGVPVCKVDFKKWLEEDSTKNAYEAALAKALSTTPPEKQQEVRDDWQKNIEAKKFKLGYGNMDLRQRAEDINAFNPDISIFIHYNAGGGNNLETGQNLGTTENFNMTFVPGSFMKGELATPEARYEFVRLLLTTDLDGSIKLSKGVIEGFKTYIEGVPIVKKDNTASYLKTACIYISEGIWARNLALTRPIHSILCYGETLCQDNYEECQQLVDKDGQAERIEQVAQAYFKGILVYYGVPEETK